MDQIIQLLIQGVIFAAFAGGAWWLLTKYKAPIPVFWIVGLIFLIILLYWAMGEFGNTTSLSRFHK
jgi:uncharacterized membrane protein